MTSGPLTGLTVLECGESIAVAYCAKLLADLGAQVVKMETPASADPSAGERRLTSLFLSLNANKRSATLDLASPEAKPVLHRLLEKTDVLVESLPTARLEALGIPVLGKLPEHPRVVHASITPFGRTGPYASYKSVPMTTAHATSQAWVVGEPGREPMALPEPQVSYLAASSAAGAIMTALLARDQLGHGQSIDLAEAEVYIATLQGQVLCRSWYLGESARRIGNRVVNAYPCTVTRCKDGYIALVVLRDDQWERFVHVIGDPAWAKDPLFATGRKRFELADELDGLLQPWLDRHTKEEIFLKCQEQRIPVAPVFDAREVLAWEQLNARGYFVAVDHEEAGTLRYPGAPYVLSKTPWRIDLPVPGLGQHTRELLCGMAGLSAGEYRSLAAQGVV